MFSILLLLFLIIRLIFDNTIIYSGAYNGLMLWYTRIVPLLLPFLLLSSIFTERVCEYTNKTYTTKSASSLLPTTTAITLGIFCGCPVGAKTIDSFYKSNIFNRTKATLLLPLCNNISPIFLAGYIHNYILKQAVPFYIIIVIIYTPYLLYGLLIGIYLLFNKQKTYETYVKNINMSTTNHELSSIVQITYIGLYIMLCSIIIELIMHYKPFSNLINLLLCGITEITTGSNLVANYNLPAKTKTALILSITSWGGICTLLQTKKAIQKSRLSMIYYTIIKFICAICTYELTILIL